MFRIVSQTSDLSPEPPRLGELVDCANQSLDRLNRPPAIINASNQTITLVAGATDVANALASAFGPLLARFEGFMEVVDQLGDHLAKVCDSIDILLCHQSLAHALSRYILMSMPHGLCCPSFTRLFYNHRHLESILGQACAQS
jgi:hypothetical protein